MYCVDCQLCPRVRHFRVFTCEVFYWAIILQGQTIHILRRVRVKALRTPGPFLGTSLTVHKVYESYVRVIHKRRRPIFPILWPPPSPLVIFLLSKISNFGPPPPSPWDDIVCGRPWYVLPIPELLAVVSFITVLLSIWFSSSQTWQILYIYC